MNTATKVLDLTCELVRRPSITPQDAGCQLLLTARLAAAGFSIECLDKEGVSNFWAQHGTRAGPVVIFAGHTDVVPTGPEVEWTSAPFEPTIRDGYLYGRGSADMKGSLAAMVIAAEQFVGANPGHAGTIALLITSDEEGDAVHGTREVVQYLHAQNLRPDYCIVGEPSSNKQLGDTVRNGRRGSLNARLSILGTQGHVAYPSQADNPIHRFAPALNALVTEVWDEGCEHYPPTSLQISNLHAGTGATNVIPGSLSVDFNIRYGSRQSNMGLRERIITLLARFDLNYEITWSLSGEPFLTEPGTLTAAVAASIQDVVGVETELSTSGGTSDGRFIAPLGCQVVELGPLNATIHKVNERVAVADLGPLSIIYLRVIERLLLA